LLFCGLNAVLVARRRRGGAQAGPRAFVQARFILDVFKELRQVVRYILPVAQAAGMANACLQRDYSPLEAPYLPS